MTEITPHNVFTPAKEITDLDRFAGRSREMKEISNALQSEGAQLVIYGQRGIGKSSLARFLINLSQSKSESINRLAEKPFKNFDYLPIYLACDDSITSIEKLLLRLLTDENALAPHLPFKVVDLKTTVEGGGKINIKILEVSGKGSQTTTEQAQTLEADLFATFTNACKSLVKSSVVKHGLLLIVDEFDRIKDRTGIASLMKTLGPEGVTFALVGVATNIQDLIKDHVSVARQLSEGVIHAEPMSDNDQIEIITRAMSALDVASRTIIWSLVKQVRVGLVPIFHGLHRRTALER